MSFILEQHGGGGGHSGGGGLKLKGEHMAAGAAVLVLLFVLMLSGRGSSGGTGFDKARGDYNVKLYGLAADRDVKVKTVQAEVDKEVVRAGVNLAGIRADAQAKRDANTTARDLGLAQIQVADLDSQRRLTASNYSADRQAQVGMAQVNAQREVGMAQVGAQREIGMAQIGAQREIGMAQVGVQQYDAETRRTLGTKQLDYGFQLGTKQLDYNFQLGTQKNTYDFQLGQGKLANEAARDTQNYNLGMDSNQVQRDGQVWGFFGDLVGGVLKLFTLGL